MAGRIVRIPERVWSSSLWTKRCQIHPETPASTLIETNTFMDTPVYEKFYCEYCYSKWRALDIENTLILRRTSIKNASKKYRYSQKGKAARKSYYAENKHEINKKRREKYKLRKKENLNGSKGSQVQNRTSQQIPK